MGGTEVALTSIRTLIYAVLGYGMFYLTMHFSDWYDINVLDDQLEFTFGDDIRVGSSTNERFLFLAMPIVVAAALGGLYEAVWKRREIIASKIGTRAEGEQSHEAERSGNLALLHGVMHFKFRPLGQYAPWLTVGEVIALSIWCLGMLVQL